MLEFFQLFNRGGWVMYVILVVSIYVLAIVLFKLVQFARLKLSDTEFSATLLSQIGSQGGLNAQVVAMQLARLKHHPHPVSRVMEGVFHAIESGVTSPDMLREEMSRIGLKQISILESKLKGLDLSASLAPLLGLLGTVLGMVTVFSSIESAGSRVEASLLAGGIWEALLTTVFGLIVAVFAQMSHHYLENKVEATRLTMNDVGIQLLQFLKK